MDGIIPPARFTCGIPQEGGNGVSLGSGTLISFLGADGWWVRGTHVLCDPRKYRKLKSSLPGSCSAPREQNNLSSGLR